MILIDAYITQDILLGKFTVFIPYNSTLTALDFPPCSMLNGRTSTTLCIWWSVPSVTFNDPLLTPYFTPPTSIMFTNILFVLPHRKYDPFYNIFTMLIGDPIL